MLKGKQYIYTLTVKSNDEPQEVTEKLNDENFIKINHP